jgi:cytochrome P450
LSQSYEATAGLIGNTVVMLGRHPELVEALRADSDMLRGVIEEVARIDSPVQNTRRWLAEDVMIGGQAMKSGDAILVLLAAANHDPRANESPEMFDVERVNRAMFTFGAGPHACPGQRLAVSIAAAGVRRVLESDIDLAALVDGVTYQKSGNVRIPIFVERNTAK